MVLLDTGHAKLMTPSFPLDLLRQIPGFENARYEDPYAGGIGNSIRYLGMAPRDNALKVEEVDNLFCGGEKAGLLVGHTEAICTGALAGYNAVKAARREKPLVLPDSLWRRGRDRVRAATDAPRKELGLKVTFSGSVYFERMKARGLYSTDPKVVSGSAQRD